MIATWYCTEVRHIYMAIETPKSTWRRNSLGDRRVRVELLGQHNLMFPLFWLPLKFCSTDASAWLCNWSLDCHGTFSIITFLKHVHIHHMEKRAITDSFFVTMLRLGRGSVWTQKHTCTRPDCVRVLDRVLYLQLFRWINSLISYAWRPFPPPLPSSSFLSSPLPPTR